MQNYNLTLQSNNIDLQTVLQTLQNKAAGGGGSGDGYEEANNLLDRNFTSYTNSRASNIGRYAFYEHYSLTTVNCPAATNIGCRAFCDCYNLTTASFPAATNIEFYAFAYCENLANISFPVTTNIRGQAFFSCGNLITASFPAVVNVASSAFYWCHNLTTISFPKATIVDRGAFAQCKGLTTVSLPAATTIGDSAFYACNKLTSLYLTNSIVCALSNSYAFSLTSIGNSSRSAVIYVPQSLLTSYQTATNWAYFSSRFAAVENSPDWDGVYGNVDADGDTGVEKIMFTINDVSYQAEAGMTWREWVNSAYNTYNYYIGYDYSGYQSEGVFGPEDSASWSPMLDDDIVVLPNDLIINNKSYVCDSGWE